MAECGKASWPLFWIIFFLCTTPIWWISFELWAGSQLRILKVNLIYLRQYSSHRPIWASKSTCGKGTSGILETKWWTMVWHFGMELYFSKILQFPPGEHVNIWFDFGTSSSTWEQKKILQLRHTMFQTTLKVKYTSACIVNKLSNTKGG